MGEGTVQGPLMVRSTINFIMRILCEGKMKVRRSRPPGRRALGASLKVTCICVSGSSLQRNYEGKMKFN